MSGIEKSNYPAFDAARDRLALKGHAVFSPADIDRSRGLHADKHDVVLINLISIVKMDLDCLLRCDAIYMLTGWENSKGAMAEKAVAEWIGLQVLHEDGAGNEVQ